MLKREDHPRFIELQSGSVQPMWLPSMCLGKCVSHARFVTYCSDIEELDKRLENAVITESIYLDKDGVQVSTCSGHARGKDWGRLASNLVFSSSRLASRGKVDIGFLYPTFRIQKSNQNQSQYKASQT